MSRQIKFRAWAVASKVMFYPDSDEGWMVSNGELVTLPNTIIMQFTGLLDKNGVEIYEGDILALGRTKEDVHKGTYEHREVKSELNSRNGYNFSYMGDTNYRAPYWVEVIGNIYQNPELLK